ncbi:MAG: glyoxalase superfamily protein [Hyphomicrobiaceae bacterium]|nr:glyoxalase superfamily protein [Hyphomicrobiaceae bacterium]
MTRLGQVVPLLRMFDVAKAKEFYVDYLGFVVDFEHRFGDNFPLYMGLSLAGCRLHLTEHHGDAAPGAHVRIDIDGIETFVADLAAKSYRFAKPGAPDEMPWGSKEITITDPFFNRLTFVQHGK